MPDSNYQRTLRARQDELNNLVHENRAFMQRLMEEGRSWSAEEKQTYERKDERITELDQMIQDAKDLEQRYEAMRQPTEDPEIESRSAPPPEVDAETRDNLRWSAFNKMLVPQAFREGKHQFTAEERAVMQTDDLAGGGYLVAPERFLNQVMTKIDDAVFIRGLSRTFTLDSAVSMGVPTVETKIDDADWQGEVQTISRDQSLVLGKRELYPRLSTKLVRASRNLVRNSGTPIADFISDEFARLFGETEENAFLTGNGSGQPLGVFTASATGISTSRDVSTGNTTTAISADNLIETLYSLKAGYQDRSTWYAHRDWVKRVRLLKDGNGQYLWQPGIAGDRPNTIIDRPYRMSEHAPNTFTTGQYVAIIGDWQFYWIVTALSMQIQVLSELYAATNEFGYIGRMEVDAMPIFEEAFARSALA